MTQKIKKALERYLSPSAIRTLQGAVQRVKWYFQIYAPLATRSIIYKVRPAVTGFPASEENQLAALLREVNLIRPTTFCRVMTRYGSDKGSHVWHNYTPIYSRLLKKRRRMPLRIFELGLGTNNLKIPSNMGAQGRPGASLRGWKRLFPNASVFGADIDRDILFEESRIKTFYCDQCCTESVKSLWTQAEMSGGMDLIVDDGLHTFAGNITFLEGALERLRPRGIYIVEDIVPEAVEDWKVKLQQEYLRKKPAYEFAFLTLPHPSNDYDNRLVVIRRNI